MEISTSMEAGRVEITRFIVSGPLNSDEPLTGMAKEAFENGSRNMLIDLSDVPYMSSAGLRALHNIYMLLRDEGESKEAVSKGLRDGSYHSPHLKILKPSKLVEEVMSTSGFDMFIEAHTKLKNAIESF